MHSTSTHKGFLRKIWDAFKRFFSRQKEGTTNGGTHLECKDCGSGEDAEFNHDAKHPDPKSIDISDLYHGAGLLPEGAEPQVSDVPYGLKLLTMTAKDVKEVVDVKETGEAVERVIDLLNPGPAKPATTTRGNPERDSDVVDEVIKDTFTYRQAISPRFIENRWKQHPGAWLNSWKEIAKPKKAN